MFITVSLGQPGPCSVLAKGQRSPRALLKYSGGDGKLYGCFSRCGQAGNLSTLEDMTDIHFHVVKMPSRAASRQQSFEKCSEVARNLDSYQESLKKNKNKDPLRD